MSLNTFSRGGKNLWPEGSILRHHVSLKFRAIKDQYPDIIAINQSKNVEWSLTFDLLLHHNSSIQRPRHCNSKSCAPSALHCDPEILKLLHLKQTSPPSPRTQSATLIYSGCLVLFYGRTSATSAFLWTKPELPLRTRIYWTWRLLYSVLGVNLKFVFGTLQIGVWNINTRNVLVFKMFN